MKLGVQLLLYIYWFFVSLTLMIYGVTKKHLCWRIWLLFLQLLNVACNKIWLIYWNNLGIIWLVTLIAVVCIPRTSYLWSFILHFKLIIWFAKAYMVQEITIWASKRLGVWKNKKQETKQIQRQEQFRSSMPISLDVHPISLEPIELIVGN